MLNKIFSYSNQNRFLSLKFNVAFVVEFLIQSSHNITEYLVKSFQSGFNVAAAVLCMYVWMSV